jgi:hypothetical protein
MKLVLLLMLAACASATQLTVSEKAELDAMTMTESEAVEAIRTLHKDSAVKSYIKALGEHGVSGKSLIMAFRADMRAEIFARRSGNAKRQQTAAEHLAEASATMKKMATEALLGKDGGASMFHAIDKAATGNAGNSFEEDEATFSQVRFKAGIKSASMSAASSSGSESAHGDPIKDGRALADGQGSSHSDSDPEVRPKDYTEKSKAFRNALKEMEAKVYSGVKKKHSSGKFAKLKGSKTDTEALMKDVTSAAKYATHGNPVQKTMLMNAPTGKVRTCANSVVCTCSAAAHTYPFPSRPWCAA